MKLKFMNKMIAIMCAVSISSSCMITSVGATDQKDIAEQIEAAKALEAAGVNSAEDIEESIALQENFDEINRKKSKNIVEQKEAAKALEAAGVNSAKDIEESIALQENFDEINRQKAAVKVQNNFRAFAAKKKVQKMREEADEELGRKLQEDEKARQELLKKILIQNDNGAVKKALGKWNSNAGKISKEAAAKRISKWAENKQKTSKARQDWNELVDGLLKKYKQDEQKNILDILGIARQRARAGAAESLTNALQNIFDKNIKLDKKEFMNAINEKALEKLKAKQNIKELGEDLRKNLMIMDIVHGLEELKAKQNIKKLGEDLREKRIIDIVDGLKELRKAQGAAEMIQDNFRDFAAKKAAKKKVDKLKKEAEDENIVKDFVGNVFGELLEKANKENELKQQVARELAEKAILQNEKKENEDNFVDVFAEHNEQLIENSKRDIARMNQDAQAKHEYGRPIVENNYNNNNQIVNNQIRNDLMLVNQELNERDNMIEEDYNPDDLLFKPEDAKKKGAGFCKNIFNAGKYILKSVSNKGKKLAIGALNKGKSLFSKIKIGGLFTGNKK